MTQTEAELEQKLIDHLTGLGYESVQIRNAADLKANQKNNWRNLTGSPSGGV